MTDQMYAVPGWFVAFLTSMIVMVIPWAVWITKHGIESALKLNFIKERVEKIEKNQESRA